MGLSKNGKRMGRPVTEDPKPFRICVRLDAPTQEALDLYCEEKDVSITEAVAIAINELAQRNGIKTKHAEQN